MFVCLSVPSTDPMLITREGLLIEDLACNSGSKLLVRRNTAFTFKFNTYMKIKTIEQIIFQSLRKRRNFKNMMKPHLIPGLIRIGSDFLAPIASRVVDQNINVIFNLGNLFY